jgi:hypothetical protein
LRTEKYSLRCVRFANVNPKSKIANPKSKIANPKSSDKLIPSNLQESWQKGNAVFTYANLLRLLTFYLNRISTISANASTQI